MSAALDDADRAALGDALRALAPVSEDDVAAATAIARGRDLARGEHLVRAGERATHVAVVVRGLAREYFVRANGAERTKAFAVEGQLMGSLADLLSTEPSRASLVAEEPTRLVVAPFARVRALAARSTAWAAVERTALEALLRAKAEREWELLVLDAEARYAAFRARFPTLEARVAAKHVASYLGITAVHLSRLRRRRATRPR